MKSRDSEQFAAPALDRGRGPRWIAGFGLTILIGLIAACSGPVEDDDSSAAAATSGLRWTLPSDVELAGAKVRLAYDEAPRWTTTSACSGKLRPGGRILGELLMDRFGAVTSVGGYACRRNTADSTRMSVHGTGRALDVFVPMVSGKANAKGDRVANWLVKNAQAAGVQLIIWNRSMWRANGTNEAQYGGPVPHTDHLHVELTEEMAARTALWFTPVDDGADAGTADSSTTTTPDAGSTTDTDASTTGTDAGTTTPDASLPAPDASTPSLPDAGTDSGTGPTAPEVDGGAEPEPTPETGDYGESSAEDEAGEENSLPDRPTRDAEYDELQTINGGCATSRDAPAPLGTAGTTLAFAVGLGVWLRRRRR